MDNRNNDIVSIHQEFIRREASLQLALRQSALSDPTLRERVFTAVGDLLCRAGTTLKHQSRRRLTAEEASAPTFLIML